MRIKESKELWKTEKVLENEDLKMNIENETVKSV